MSEVAKTEPKNLGGRPRIELTEEQMTKKQKTKTWQEILAEEPLPDGISELFDWVMHNEKFQQNCFGRRG